MFECKIFACLLRVQKFAGHLRADRPRSYLARRFLQAFGALVQYFQRIRMFSQVISYRPLRAVTVGKRPVASLKFR